MSLPRVALTVARRAVVQTPALRRSFVVSAARFDANPSKAYKKLSEVRSEDDLLGPGATSGSVPTDVDQATGLERLEILGKMEGVDVFNMKPLDSSRKGTMENPITVKSYGEEQYAGCTGSPSGSHIVTWLTITKDRPIERCPECGSVYKMEYLGAETHDHHDHHGYEEPKTFADYIKPEYRYV